MARKTFGEALQNAKASDTTSTDAPPDGTYTATATSFNIRPAKSGEPRLGIRFVVDSGPQARKSVWTSQMLRVAEEVNVRIFRKLCEAFGIDPESELSEFDVDTNEDIEKILTYVGEKAVSQRVEIKVVTREGFPSEAKYVNRLPKDAAPSQIDAAKKGVAAVAAASAKPAAKRTGPRAAI